MGIRRFLKWPVLSLVGTLIVLIVGMVLFFRDASQRKANQPSATVMILILGSATASLSIVSYLFIENRKELDRLREKQKEAEELPTKTEQFLEEMMRRSKVAEKQMMNYVKSFEEVQQMRYAQSDETLRQTLRRLEEKQEQIGAGGYIVIDMPDSQKRMFQDLLLGFEEFAALKGYSISFSVDNSVSNRIAFKFNFADGMTIKSGEMQSDLREYINKVQKGEPLTELPMVLPPMQHQLLFMTMQNRINCLQNNYDFSRLIVAKQEAMIEALIKATVQTKSAPINITVQSGGANESRNLLTFDSPQAIQGEHNKIIGSTVDQSIYIAESFNERHEQIEALERLEKLLPTPHDTANPDELLRLYRSLDDAKQELLRKKPDPTRVIKWLETAKYGIKALGLTAEVHAAAVAAWELFKMTFNLG